MSYFTFCIIFYLFHTKLPRLLIYFSVYYSSFPWFTLLSCALLYLIGSYSNFQCHTQLFRVLIYFPVQPSAFLYHILISCVSHSTFLPYTLPYFAVFYSCITLYRFTLLSYCFLYFPVWHSTFRQHTPLSYILLFYSITCYFRHIQHVIHPSNRLCLL